MLERDRRLRANRVLRALSASTNGLPSRSPPIHEPMRRNARHARGVDAEFARKAGSRARRYSRGISSQKRVAVVGEAVVDLVSHLQLRQRAASPSATARAPGGSRPDANSAVSSGVSVDAVAPRAAAARSRARSRGCSCAGPRSGARSARAHQRVVEPVLRLRRVHAAPARDGRSASAMLPRCGGDPASACARRRRFWCTSSAMLARCEK